MPPPPLPERSHRMTYRVPYAETDQMGRVYYANYLIWLERARTEMMRHAGAPYAEMERAGLYLPVRRCEMRYAGYAVYDDEVVFRTWIDRLRHASVTFSTLIFRGDEEHRIAWGMVELACVDGGGKPACLPETLHALLSAWIPGEERSDRA